MPRALVFLAPGFEEIEFTATVNILRRADIDVKMVSIAHELKPVAGKTGIQITPDCLVSDIEESEVYDLLSLPGGLPAAEAFSKSEAIGHIYRRHNNQGKIVAAICASPIALSAHKINHGSKLTCYPALAIRLDGNYKYSCDNVVVDNNMVTSRGPGTALEYGLKLVELLCGKEKRDQVADGMLYSI